MSDNEQRCAIKFCFRLGRNATEIFAKLLQAYGDMFCQGPRLFGGLRHFQKEESQLKMNLAVEGPQFEKPLKMSLESGILCVQIVA
ncbi:uncharacterized protein TNCV_4394441 [Trichonephila clavipes]|uniref:Mos1 transposase HTH domain-containing protein n=1 Tax=Trichonephila clavipes TaxID=2585209 RepID=A0A8X7BE06_TRICX|nr:uncharacterized protein TNCV_4394441 [Trichonephila clavipes]